MKQEIAFVPLTLKHRHLTEPGMNRYRLMRSDGTAVTMRARSALDALSSGQTGEVRRMLRQAYETVPLIDETWLTEAPETQTLPLPSLSGESAGENAPPVATVRLPVDYRRGLQILTLEEMQRERPAGDASVIQSAEALVKPLSQEEVKRLLSEDNTGM